MDELLELGKQVLASQPFSTLVGAELTAFSVGQVELTIPITPQLKQQHGFVHGGVIGYAADNALTFVGGSVLGPAVVTSEYKIITPATKYIKP
jgi:acyl-coenzyme A thioesterase PaaI-like protein